MLIREPEAVKNYLILIKQLTAYSPPGEGLERTGVRTFPAQGLCLDKYRIEGWKYRGMEGPLEGWWGITGAQTRQVRSLQIRKTLNQWN